RIYPRSLHDALPISGPCSLSGRKAMRRWWLPGVAVLAGLLVVSAAGIITSKAGRTALAQQGDVGELARRAIGGPGAAGSVGLLPDRKSTRLNSSHVA